MHWRTCIAGVVMALVGAALVPARASAQFDRLPPTLSATDETVFDSTTVYLDDEGVATPAPPYYGRFGSSSGHGYTWQILPEGLMYRAYLAGIKESRLASTWVRERDLGWQWESTLGARVGMIRYGTRDPFYPQGWQLDVEGAAFPRLDLEDNRNLTAADFRVGVPLTWREGPYEAKFGYYHLSSHLGDEFLETHPDAVRNNFSRDVLILGVAMRPTLNTRIYGEAGWAFYSDVSEPWEFQFGIERAPFEPTGLRGGPFVAVNAHLREEVEFGGTFVAQAGWAWRSAEVGRLFRLGVEYTNGKSRQFQFFDQFEEQIGGGIWYDF